MRRFLRETLPRRVVFGAGSVEQIAEEAEALGLKRVLVVGGGSAGSLGGRVADLLGERAAGRFERVRQHVPADLAAEAVRAAGEIAADGLCSVGGGSATGLAKAIALKLEVPIIAVPTTYAGSEMTSIYGVTGARKRTGRDARVQPRVIIYDPELTVRLPARVTAASGLNAMAHAAAALLNDSDPVSCLKAEEAVRVLAQALPVAVRQPADLEVRGDALYGAFLAGGALAAGSGRHHRLCHVLGGAHRAVHADIHAVLLPHTVAWERDAGAPGIARLAAALGTDDPAQRLHALALALGAPLRLADVGISAEALTEAAGDVLREHGADDARQAARAGALVEDVVAGRFPRAPDLTQATADQGGAR